MKKVLVLLAVLMAVGVQAYAQADGMKSGASYILDENGNLVETTKPILNFEQESFDFGDVPEGPQVTHEFKFKNDGKEPLVIADVKASCGCTTPDWPKEPVMPGEEAVIKATYNTSKRIGPFNKAITITSNAYEPTKRLYIKGTVLQGEQPQKEETMPVRTQSIVNDGTGNN
ncbi:hypothetical protein C7N43_16770 [Sphingobacteriales bacterium UPWRP_1]|nr:hypothetical protein C7N43_16770 [Sphingobacteriales bacterium UPWRP_1]